MKKILLILTLLCGLAAIAVAQSGTMLLNAAGATFPYPDLLEVVRCVPHSAPERSDQLSINRLWRRNSAADGRHG